MGCLPVWTPLVCRRCGRRTSLAVDAGGSGFPNAIYMLFILWVNRVHSRIYRDRVQVTRVSFHARGTRAGYAEGSFLDVGN